MTKQSKGFIDDALSLLGRLADACADENRRIVFFAHAFAVCEYLWRKESSVFMPVASVDARGASTDWRELAQTVRSLRGASASQVVTTLLISMLRLEDWFQTAYRDRRLPQHTRLLRVDDDDVCALHGTVVHWRRGAADLGTLIRERARDRHLAHYRNQPRFALRRVALVWNHTPPHIVPVKCDDPRVTPQLLRAPLSAQQQGPSAFKVALCPLDLTAGGAFCPQFSLSTASRSFAAGDAPMKNTGDLRSHLEALLDDALREHIHLLVLPELCVDVATRRWLGEQMRRRFDKWPKALVAGSFHVGADGERVNESPLLDHNGSIWWRHRKRGRFRVTGRQVRAAPTMFPGPLPTFDDDDEFQEAIIHGKNVGVLDARIGRVAHVICADVLDTNAFGPLWEAGIDLLLVPSMSIKTTDFEDWALRLGRIQTAMMYVNAGCVLPRTTKSENKSVAAFCFLPFPRLGEGAPTWVRWTPFAASPMEEYDARARTWAPYEPADGGPYTLLPDKRGMVIQLEHFHEEWMDKEKD